MWGLKDFIDRSFMHLFEVPLLTAPSEIDSTSCSPSATIPPSAAQYDSTLSRLTELNPAAGAALLFATDSADYKSAHEVAARFAALILNSKLHSNSLFFIVYKGDKTHECG